MNTIKLIIADDNIAYVNVLSKTIEKDNRFMVIGTAENCEIEKQMIDTFHPDVVITDIKRGNKRVGLDVVKQYLSEPNPPIFVITSAIIDIKELLDLNIAYYINKPFDYSKIMEILNRIYHQLNPLEMIEQPSQQMNTYKTNFLKRIFHFNS